MSNSLDPDQARRFVGPNLGPTVCQDYQQTTLVDKELGLHKIYARGGGQTWADFMKSVDMFHNKCRPVSLPVRATLNLT